MLENIKYNMLTQWLAKLFGHHTYTLYLIQSSLQILKKPNYDTVIYKKYITSYHLEWKGR